MTHKPKNSIIASTHKCSNCNTTKTPLWRSGPLGAKTLCNACGVKWSKGKLKLNSNGVEIHSNRQDSANWNFKATKPNNPNQHDSTTNTFKMSNVQQDYDGDTNMLGTSSSENVNNDVEKKEQHRVPFFNNTSSDVEDSEDKVHDDDARDDVDDDDEEKDKNYQRNNYLSITIEQFTPILTRALNPESEWTLKELIELRDEVKDMFDESSHRVNFLKNLYEKFVQSNSKNPNEILQYLEANEYDYPKNKKRKYINGKRKFREGDKLKSSKSKPKICGVVNSRGKPCQRTGFCPFHHKLSGSKKTYSLRNSSSSEQLDDESYSEDESSVDVTRNSSSKIRLTNRKRDRMASMQISILLIAAAAIERQSMDKNQPIQSKVQPINTLNQTASTTTKNEQNTVVEEPKQPRSEQVQQQSTESYKFPPVTQVATVLQNHQKSSPPSGTLLPPQKQQSNQQSNQQVATSIPPLKTPIPPPATQFPSLKAPLKPPPQILLKPPFDMRNSQKTILPSPQQMTNFSGVRPSFNPFSVGDVSNLGKNAFTPFQERRPPPLQPSSTTQSSQQSTTSQTTAATTTTTTQQLLIPGLSGREGSTRI